MVGYCHHGGFPHAERRALGGAQDKGDVLLCPGVISEVKNCKTLAIPAWLRETEDEVRNANAVVGFLTVKPKGIGGTRVGDWWALMRRGPWEALTASLGGAGEPLEVLPGSGYVDLLPAAVKRCAGHELGYVAIQPRGVDQEGLWYVATRLEQMLWTLRRVGFGSEVALTCKSC